jgi:hypothetical protein
MLSIYSVSELGFRQSSAYFLCVRFPRYARKTYTKIINGTLLPNFLSLPKGRQNSRHW